MACSDPICIAHIHVVMKSFLSCYYNVIFCFMKHYFTSHSCFESVGMTPLHSAAMNGSTDVLNILCNTHGCDINAKVMCANLVLVCLLCVKRVLINFMHMYTLYQYT